MVKKQLLIVALGIAALAGTSSQAKANITYALSGVTLSDGGTLTGTFTTDDADSTVVSAAITASATASFPGFTYTVANSTVFVLPTTVYQFTSGSDILRLTFAGTGLSSTGGTLVTNGAAYEVEGGFTRIITGGVAAVAVPEPSSMALLGTSSVFGLIAWYRRRRPIAV